MAILVGTSLLAAVATTSAVWAEDPPPPPPGAASGLSSDSAAASCWEIKQLYPSSPDGVYWLRTEQLVRPDRFYCDMTTDGGGWLLIGRGRQGWTFSARGQGTTQQLVDAVSGSAAFAPAALSSTTIDALLGGGAVSELADGLRVRRAANTAGTQWQELRWWFADLGAWSWAFGGGHRLRAFSIDGALGSGSNTKDSSIRMAGESGAGNRSATNRNGWYTYPWSGHGGQAGFSYRGTVSGANDNSSYLYEYRSENQAIPFTQLFLRPQLTSAALTPIPDDGLPPTSVTDMLSDRPVEIAGGVRGVHKTGDSWASFDVPVLAITTAGDRVYVGGKFAQVRDASTGELVDHGYLAAFDRRTGAWIPTFRPVLDGSVWALEVVGDRLLVGGQFTSVNRADGTSALAALDLVTGEVVAGWRASLAVTGTTQRPVVRALDVDGDWVYVGGNFTRIEGPRNLRAVGRLARVAVADGEPDTRFRPNVDGIPYDVDATGDTVQVVGQFAGINGVTRQSVGTLRTTDGSVVTGLAEPIWSNATNRYQLAVTVAGSDVWQGGSEHNVHVYDAATYALRTSFITYDQGGDTQVFEPSGSMMMQGSHGNAFVYSDAMTWPGVDGYTRTDLYNWIGMFDAASHRYQRDWVPSLASAYTEGAWALHTDVDGCLWFGGDFLGGPYVGGQRQYLESFSKFCPQDTTAPTPPSNVRATLDTGGVSLRWSSATDDRPGYIGYEILRNDQVISPLVYGGTYVDPHGTVSDRYFVRAVDATGNRSATTPVVVPADTSSTTTTLPPVETTEPADLSQPTTPTALVATLDAEGDGIDISWGPSRDNVGVDRYEIIDTNVSVATVPGDVTSLNLPALPGNHWVQVRAYDAAGNASHKTPSVQVTVPAPPAPDTTNPTTPRDLVAVVEADGSVSLSWTASRDDVGVDRYRITRNGVEVLVVPGSETAAVVVGLGPGTHYLQAQAFDAAGNASHKTPSTIVAI